MKFATAVPLLASLSAAFVLPDNQQVFAELELESTRETISAAVDSSERWLAQQAGRIESTVDQGAARAQHCAHQAGKTVESGFEYASSWLADSVERVQEQVYGLEEVVADKWADFTNKVEDEDVRAQWEWPRPPFRRPDGDHPPPEGHRPHHRPPPHHHKPNLTVYELISKSKYTTKLAKLIDDFPDIVELLNGTTANFTVFAPLDSAFDKIKIPDDKKDKIPMALIKAVLLYHVSPEFYPAGRVLKTDTIPTALENKWLSDSPADTPQRLAVSLGLGGLRINFFSKVVAVDIFGTNGVIHGLSDLLLLPPKIANVISLIPAEFSTLSLGLEKTGLAAKLNDTSAHLGATVFAPSNYAFKKLGFKANALLFSKYGEKYLKALLLYHTSLNNTLYTDAFYKYGSKPSDVLDTQAGRSVHVDLPTGLGDKTLSIDILPILGGFKRAFVINGFYGISAKNGVARDGVIHVVPQVLIPPKSAGTGEEGPRQEYRGGEVSVEYLKEVLGPYVET